LKEIRDRHWKRWHCYRKQTNRKMMISLRVSNSFVIKRNVINRFDTKSFFTQLCDIHIRRLVESISVYIHIWYRYFVIYICRSIEGSLNRIALETSIDDVNKRQTTKRPSIILADVNRCGRSMTNSGPRTIYFKYNRSIHWPICYGRSEGDARGVRAPLFRERQTRSAIRTMSPRSAVVIRI